MSLRRFTLKKLTAALLPLTFLWLCACCCIFTCGQEAGAKAQAQPAASPTALFEVKGETGCEEGCPRAPDLKAASPESATLRAGPQATAAAVPPSALTDTHAGHPFCSWSSRQPPRAAPPLELLSVLRI